VREILYVLLSCPQMVILSYFDAITRKKRFDGASLLLCAERLVPRTL